MLAYMTSELQKQHEAMDFYTIVFHMRELFGEQAISKRFEVSKLLFCSKMAHGTSPVQYALKMNGYIVRLEQLGFKIDHELSIDLILTGLFDSFAQFVLSYRMNNIESSIPKLINMLKVVEPSLKKEGKAVMLIEPLSSKKSSKNKKKSTKVKRGVVKKKVVETTPKGTCFHYGKSGH